MQTVVLYHEGKGAFAPCGMPYKSRYFYLWQYVGGVFIPFFNDSNLDTKNISNVR